MPDAYIDSNATGSNTGADWANAYNAGNNTDWTNAATRASDKGDIIYAADNNYTNLTADLNFTANATHTGDDPLRILVCPSGTTTPVDNYGAAANGEIDGGSAYHIAFAGNVYLWGLRILQGDGFTVFNASQGVRQTYERCLFACTKDISSEGYLFNVGTIIFKETDVELSGQAHALYFASDGGALFWCGGKYTHTFASPPELFSVVVGRTGNLTCFGVDFSGSNNPTRIIQVNAAESFLARFVGCIYPSSYTLVDSNDYGNMQYTQNVIDVPLGRPREIGIYAREGDVKHQTTIYRGGGANDGDNNYSLNFDIDGADRTNYASYVHELATVHAGNLSGKTVKIHFAQNSGAALNTDEIWADVITEGACNTSRIKPGSGSPHTDESGSEDWRDGAGALTGYNEQSISVSGFGTTSGAAVILLNVSVDFSANNLYVCPKVEIA